MQIVRIRAIVLTLVLLFTAPLYAQQRTDVVVMKNGDHFTCEIVELVSGALYVKLDYVDGTITVQWSQVARLESDRLMIVKTQNGSVYSGRVSTVESSSGQPVRIQVTESPEKNVVLDRAQIVAMDRTSEKFWQRFNGEINSGIVYAKGNQSTQYNLGVSVEYPRDRWSAGIDFNSSLASNNGSETTTRNQFDFEGRHLLHWNNHFYEGTGSFLQSSEQGIDLQTSLGGGIGRYFKNTNNARISVLGGIAWQRTTYSRKSGSSAQNVAAAVITGEVKLFKFKKTNLNISATLLPAISEAGRVYFKTNESYYIKVFKNLSWNLSFYGNWDSRPPPGLSGSDFGASSGLSWTFGNK